MYLQHYVVLQAVFLQFRFLSAAKAHVSNGAALRENYYTEVLSFFLLNLAK